MVFLAAAVRCDRLAESLATPPVVLGNAAQIDREEFAIFKQTQVQLLKSNMVINGVLRDSQINQLPTVQQHADEPVAWLKESLLIDYPDDAEIMRHLAARQPPETIWSRSSTGSWKCT